MPDPTTALNAVTPPVGGMSMTVPSIQMPKPRYTPEELDTARTGLAETKAKSQIVQTKSMKMMDDLEELNAKKNPRYTELQEQIKEADKALMAPPPTLNNGIEPKAIVALGVMALLGGLGTRQHVTNSINALSFGLKGYQEGNEKQFNLAHQAWKEQSDLAIRKSQALSKELDQVINSDKTTREQKEAQLKNLLSVNGLLKDQAADYDKMLETSEKYTTAHNKAVSDLVSIDNRLDAIAHRQAQVPAGLVPKLDNDGKIIPGAYERTKETAAEQLARKESLLQKKEEARRETVRQTEQIKVEAKQKAADAKIAAEMKAEYPVAKQGMEESIRYLEKMAQAAEKLADHPKLDVIMDPLYQRAPTVSDETANAESLLSIVKDTAVIQAVRSLKALSKNGATGFGSLTEKEGSRLEIAQSGVGKAGSREFVREQLLTLAEEARESETRLRQGFEAAYAPVVQSPENPVGPQKRTSKSGITYTVEP